jgi:GTP diphosphokinase / guanosine-3',5'-bis(diphosphate) 3'-diphosphatase
MVIENIKSIIGYSSNSLPKDFSKLLNSLKKHQELDQITIDLIYNAYCFGKKAHEGQKRKSGEPYFIHCVEVATILADWGMDQNIVISGLLHDTIEDTEVTKETIELRYGSDVLFLVESVTKLSDIKFNSRTQKKAENFMKMFISFANDIRAIIIKLADRLHNLRTITFLSKIKQRRLALESKEIFSPLAHRIGMNNVKMEMEDIIFSILEPSNYKKIKNLVKSNRKDRESYIKSFINPLDKELNIVHVDYEMFGRAKHFYSIHNKMKSRNISFSEIFDQFAIRIIVEKVKDCYMVLGIIHQLYTPLQDRFKDYIAMPKSNGYQSIHTTVFGKEGKMVEVQIRTNNMNDIAEIGVAAHWIYKDESDQLVKKEKILEKFAWIRDMIDELNNDSKNPQEFMDMLKTDLFHDEIFVFTPTGDVIQLLEHATPIDFAFQVHSEVGLKCTGAKVNGHIVPLNTHLKNGDSVEIITSEGKNPSYAWLQIVKMPKSKNHIKRWIKKNEYKERIILGREILEKGLRKIKKIGLLKKIKENHHLFGNSSEESIYIDLANGQITVKDLVIKIEPKDIIEDIVEDESLTQKFIRKARGIAKGVTVGGISNTLINYGKCCNPIPGDEIIGYVTLGRGVTIHRASCNNYPITASNRLIPVEWDISNKSKYIVRLKIEGEDRKDLAKDIIECTSNFNMNIFSINMSVSSGLAKCMLIVEVRDIKQLNRLQNKLKTINRIYKIERQ